MLKCFNDWIKSILSLEEKKIYCLQVEVSTCCQLSCSYCPRTVLRDHWTDALLDLQLYKNNLLPYFDAFEMIFLQGWGEPLLNPYLWDMARFAKARGNKVGFATNGILLSKEAAERACDLDIDVISFTFTGSTGKTHEMYRKGASFKELCGRVRMLAEEKQKRGAKTLQIGVSYTMMRRNLAELPQMIELAAELGANYVTASHMDCIPAKSLETEAVFLDPDPEDDLYLIRAVEKAASLEITFKTEGLYQSGELLVCEPYPFHTNVFVTADGRVVPCHFMGLPINSTSEIFFRGEPYSFSPIVIGNANRQPLKDILSNKAAQEIKEIFNSRTDMSLLSSAGIKTVPEFCRTCYKLYGV